MRVVLISTYELGHQPFGLASPAAHLTAAGAHVTCLDLAVSHIDPDAVAAADLIAFYLPMHTATRIAAQFVPRVRALNAAAPLVAYGLYAPVNADYLRDLGFQALIGGEFEAELVAIAHRLMSGESLAFDTVPRIALERQAFLTPDRSGLPHLSQYAYLQRSDGCRRVVAYTEASRGCKHTCRHCPIVPVYGGQFRVVPFEVVIEDIEQQIDAGAGHITFGDPDFFNGPGHALAIVEKVHQLWPQATYDVTIKIEHLVKQRKWLPVLRDTGCLFITSAVEAVDDRILEKLDKRHTRADFSQVVHELRALGIAFNPTFVAFSPWLSLDGYCDLLRTIAALDLIDHVAPVQYTIRLLIPAGSKLLELAEVRELIGPFEAAALAYPWAHPDPRVDALQARVLDIVTQGQAAALSRGEIFDAVWAAAHAAVGEAAPSPRPDRVSQAIPHLSEDWYC